MAIILIVILAGLVFYLATRSSTPPKPAQVSAGNSPFKGNSSADVEIIEFSDYDCPYCKNFHDDTLPQIMQNYGDKIKFAYREYPVHPGADKASEAALCANDQGKFWQYHDKLFEEQNIWPSLGIPQFKKYAADLGLNADQFNSCLDSGKRTADVNTDLEDGKSYGVTGTPTFFILKNGELFNEPITGAYPYSTFQMRIASALLS